MKTRIAVLLVLLAAGCKVQNNAALVIGNMVPGKLQTTTGTTGGACLFDPGAQEVDFLPLNPAENTGTMGVVVQNQIQATSSVNGILFTDSSMFLPHQAVVDYEVVGVGAVGSQKVVAVSGATVPGGGKGSVITPLVPAGSVPATTAPGSVLRVTFHLEGKLVDGRTVHTTEREYLFVICNGAGCAGNPCL